MKIVRVFLVFTFAKFVFRINFCFFILIGWILNINGSDCCISLASYRSLQKSLLLVVDYHLKQWLSSKCVTVIIAFSKLIVSPSLMMIILNIWSIHISSTNRCCLNPITILGTYFFIRFSWISRGIRRPSIISWICFLFWWSTLLFDKLL